MLPRFDVGDQLLDGREIASQGLTEFRDVRVVDLEAHEAEVRTLRQRELQGVELDLRQLRVMQRELEIHERDACLADRVDRLVNPSVAGSTPREDVRKEP